MEVSKCEKCGCKLTEENEVDHSKCASEVCKECCKKEHIFGHCRSCKIYLTEEEVDASVDGYCKECD